MAIAYILCDLGALFGDIGRNTGNAKADVESIDSDLATTFRTIVIIAALGGHPAAEAG